MLLDDANVNKTLHIDKYYLHYFLQRDKNALNSFIGCDY